MITNRSLRFPELTRRGAVPTAAERGDLEAPGPRPSFLQKIRGGWSTGTHSRTDLSPILSKMIAAEEREARDEVAVFWPWPSADTASLRDRILL